MIKNAETERERERERASERQTERETDRERQREIVSYLTLNIGGLKNYCCQS